MVSIASEYTNFTVIDWWWWSHCANEWIDEFPMYHYEKLPPSGLLIPLTEQQTRTKTLFLLTAFYKRRTIISKLTLQTRKRRTFLEGDIHIKWFIIRLLHVKNFSITFLQHQKAAHTTLADVPSRTHLQWPRSKDVNKQRKRLLLAPSRSATTAAAAAAAVCSHHCLLANVT